MNLGEKYLKRVEFDLDRAENRADIRGYFNGGNWQHAGPKTSFVSGNEDECSRRYPLDLKVAELLNACERAIENDDAACGGPGTLGEALKALMVEVEDA